MNKLLVYLKDYKKECVLAPLFKMLEAVFELTVPLVIADMIDRGIGSGSNTVILRAFFILILLGITGLTVSCTAQYFAAKAAVGFGTALRHDLFAHIGTLSFADIDRAGIPTLITGLTGDINQVQTGINLGLRSGI